MLRVIPVIDLKAGVVVRAIRGDRASYAAIETPLAPATSEPLAIATALLRLWSGFDCLYVADIDAITQVRRNAGRAVAAELSNALPGVRFLLDDGAACVGDLNLHPGTSLITPVIGTETLGSISELKAIGRATSGAFALSLDWRDDEILGPKELFGTPQDWPETVIVMTLDRVGARAGPDFNRLAAVKARAGRRQVLAAGGVRDLDDLRKLQSIGCGALVATALHDQSIKPADLQSLVCTE